MQISNGTSANTIWGGSNYGNLVLNALNAKIVVANGTFGANSTALLSNGTGIYWGTVTAAASPGGTNTSVQYNDSGTIGGDSFFRYDKAAFDVFLGNTTTSAAANLVIQSNTGTTTLSLATGTSQAVNNIITSSSIAVTSATGNTQLAAGSLLVANSTANIFVVNTSTYAATGNGYTTLPGGMILQWGTVLANSSVGNVVFSTNTGKAFTSAIWSATATGNTSRATGSGNWTSIILANTTQISIRTANTTALSLVRWMAIGI